MIQSVEQINEEEMSAIKRQVIAVVGDSDTTLTKQLVEAVGNGSTDGVINLDTKYYQTHVGILQFTTGNELLKMKKESPGVIIGAIILKLGSRNHVEIMENVIQEINCDSHVLVADCCSSDDVNFAQSWAQSFNFELVILDPNKSQREEAMSLSEKCGIARVVEVLENVPWQLRKENFKKVTGKQELDRLLAIIEAMSDSSEDSDAEPDDEDREAIWQAFSSYSVPPSNADTSTVKECEEEISVDVTIGKVTLRFHVNSVRLVSTRHTQWKPHRKRWVCKVVFIVVEILV
uniref:40S ribosomal protein S12 n=1 Tax=Angiostrongylus cantonensis TaxID=6313 RepID=A0A0K0D2P3_ANGCA